VFTVLYEVK